jgi:hypothetical protein
MLFQKGVMLTRLCIYDFISIQCRLIQWNKLYYIQIFINTSHILGIASSGRYTGQSGSET